MKQSCIFLFLVFSFISNAQLNKIDSLKNEIHSNLRKKEKALLLLDIGKFYLETTPDSALSYSHKSLLISEKLKLETAIAQSLLLQGQALNSMDKFTDALIPLEQAEKLFNKKNDKINLGKTYFETGLSFYGKGRNDSTLYFLKKSALLFDQDENLEEIAHVERITGLCYWSLGKYAEGLVHINKAVSLYENLNDKIYLTRAKNTKGALLWGLGNYEEALNFFFDALKLQEKISTDSGRIIIYYNNIGMVYSDWGNREKALEYFLKAEALITKTDNKTGIAYTYLNLGTYYYNMKEYNPAIDFLEKSKKGYNEINDINGVCLSKIRLGQCNYDLGNYILARSFFQDAKKDAKISGNTHRKATTLFHLGKNELALKNNDLAKYYIEKSIEIAEKERYEDLLFQQYKELSKSYEEIGDIKTSLDFLKKTLDYQDKIYKKKISVQFKILEVSQEIAQKEFENERLKTQNKTKEKTIWYGSIAVFITVLLLVAITIYSFSLSKKKKELQQANEIKDKIFSIVAHDLRGPVGNLNNMIDLMVSEDNNTNNYKNILNRFKPIITSTFNMLENLLVWAKANLGNLDVVKKKTPINQTINETILLFKNVAKEKSITVEYKRKDNIFVFADVVQLQTILRNLLNNAIKFTNTGGHITIQSQAKNQEVIVSIQDNGIGISAKNQKGLFEGTTSSPGTNKEKGSGIGLFLCKELVEKNSGTIWVESTEGNGSTFYFSIPLFFDKNMLNQQKEI